MNPSFAARLDGYLPESGRAPEVSTTTQMRFFLPHCVLTLLLCPNRNIEIQTSPDYIDMTTKGALIVSIKVTDAAQT
jgi:hypothetical protein